ncbi:MAG: hypothetical protein JNK25_15615 [Phycisphaerae bacterium]|nr:hypothetical protein [Phycisphaerae bacterium]
MTPLLAWTPSPVQFAAYAAALALILLGVWFLLYRPDPDDDPPPSPGDQAPWTARVRHWRDTRSGPTRTVFGLVMILTGYHAAAWAGPDAVFAFRVPPERWWILAGALVVSVACALVSDRIERD